MKRLQVPLDGLVRWPRRSGLLRAKLNRTITCRIRSAAGALALAVAAGLAVGFVAAVYVVGFILTTR